MPHDLSVDRDSKIAVVHCTGHFTLAEHVAMVHQLVADSSLDPSFTFLFDCSRVEVPPTPEEMGPVADSLRELDGKFPGRKAVLATLPGYSSILGMIGMLAGDGDFEAFTNEAAAREWLSRTTA